MEQETQTQYETQTQAKLLTKRRNANAPKRENVTTIALLGARRERLRREKLKNVKIIAALDENYQHQGNS